MKLWRCLSHRSKLRKSCWTFHGSWCGIAPWSSFLRRTSLSASSNRLPMKKGSCASFSDSTTNCGSRAGHSTGAGAATHHRASGRRSRATTRGRNRRWPPCGVLSDPRCGSVGMRPELSSLSVFCLLVGSYRLCHVEPAAVVVFTIPDCSSSQ